MKLVCSWFVCFCICGAPLRSAEDTKEAPVLVGGPIAEIQFALYRTDYPVAFKDLFERLGGERTLKWCCGRGQERGGVLRHLEDFTITQVPAADGEYQVEFEIREIAGDPVQTIVVSARVCFLSPHGRFYAEDLKSVFGEVKAEKTEANKAVDPTPVSAPSDSGGPSED